MYRMRNLILSMGVAVGIWTYHPCSAYIQSISQPRHRCYDPYTSQIDIQIAKPTEKQVEFTVYGVPEALARHRVNPRLEYAMYNPSAQSQKIFLKACIDELPETPYTGPLQVELNFYFGRPKVHFRSGKNSHLLKDDAPLWHTNRKDIDNLIKFVLDALNQKAYVDDKQVVVLHSKKQYTNELPRTEVKIMALE